jgi:hypothetical protein
VSAAEEARKTTATTSSRQHQRVIEAEEKLKKIEI